MYSHNNRKELNIILYSVKIQYFDCVSGFRLVNNIIKKMKMILRTKWTLILHLFID